MRTRFGVAMPPKGGRTAIIGLEVREGRTQNGRVLHDYTVGVIERVQPFTVDAAREKVIDYVTAMAEVKPCAIIDVTTPQGLALHQSLKGAWDASLHKAHAYTGDTKGALFANFLQVYTSGRLRFRPGLKYRDALDKALVFYLGGGVQKHGLELESEDEAMVVALGLALQWPKHGAPAAPYTSTQEAR